ncbi:LysE family translocator [Bombella sp. TMW 2.2559]|uniref:LysE family translocator n=1 Tax=Bombella dulcis TaxID=2967339 RepID=A0ABT3W8L0_9PROT|nr:LysE family translocator [Bombella dulcis]MCX5615400.1 LysE family translocator [Bombella dulcis]
MPFSILSAFWLVSFLFIMSPGMDWAYAITAGSTGRRVIPAVSGMVLGHFLIILLVAAGLGSLLRATPFALPAITFCGALYLLWLGIGQLRAEAALPGTVKTSSGSALHWLGKGVTVSLFNPKVMMIIMAVLPQFLQQGSPVSPYWQISLLGFIHCLTCLCVYLAVGYGAHLLLSARPRMAGLVNRLSGCSMTGIALLMLGETCLKQM